MTTLPDLQSTGPTGAGSFNPGHNSLEVPQFKPNATSLTRIVPSNGPADLEASSPWPARWLALRRRLAPFARECAITLLMDFVKEFIKSFWSG